MNTPPLNAFAIPSIDGDYFTIIGLPIIPLLEKLRKLNANGIIK